MNLILICLNRNYELYIMYLKKILYNVYNYFIFQYKEVYIYFLKKNQIKLK